MISETLNEIQTQADFCNINIDIDSTSLKKDNIYVVSSEEFTGFIYVENNKENFILFNNSVMKYAFEEGFHIDKIYECFKNKLFSFISKEDFLEKLIRR